MTSVSEEGNSFHDLRDPELPTRTVQSRQEGTLPEDCRILNWSGDVVWEQAVAADGMKVYPRTRWHRIVEGQTLLVWREGFCLDEWHELFS
jgi:hypothetical protein